MRPTYTEDGHGIVRTAPFPHRAMAYVRLGGRHSILHRRVANPAGAGAGGAAALRRAHAAAAHLAAAGPVSVGHADLTGPLANPRIRTAASPQNLRIHHAAGGLLHP